MSITQVPMELDLYDFQQEAVDHCLSRDNLDAYVALDMGLGKSPVGICLSASAISAGVRPVLVVVPPSLRTNWVREFSKFAPWLSTAVLQGTKVDHIPDVDVLIIGDSTIYHWAQALTGRVGALIVDEAHRHKNDSKRSRALSQIAQSISGLKVLLSGTPTPNGRHVELVSQMNILGSQAWNDIGGVGTFWHQFCVKGSWGKYENGDTDTLHDRMTSTWMFRRVRDDVIDLPSKNRVGVAFPATGAGRSNYLKAEENLIEYLKEQGRDIAGAQRAEALVKLSTLRRLAGEAKVPSIAERTNEILDEIDGGVLIIAENTDVIDKLMIKLSKHNPVAIRGGQSDKAKTASVDAFTSGKSRVLIGQITAASTGFTLHGGGLNNRVIIAQLPWTPADLRQAEDRLHRIGQTTDVLVEVALCHVDDRETIDERLFGQLEAKQYSTGRLIDGEGDVLIDEIFDGLLESYR